MKLFIKKKKGNLEEQGFSRMSINRLNEAIEKRKVLIAGWLGKKSEAYSTKQKRIGLIIFSTLVSFLFVMLLARSVRSPHFNYRTIILSHPRSGVRDPLHSPITDSIFKKVEQTRIWLDSLRKNDTPRLKAILLSKPYLLENLQLLEQLYKIQSK